MVAKKAGTGVKNKALYKRLRNLGVSAKESEPLVECLVLDAGPCLLLRHVTFTSLYGALGRAVLGLVVAA